MISGGIKHALFSVLGAFDYAFLLAILCAITAANLGPAGDQNNHIGASTAQAPKNDQTEANQPPPSVLKITAPGANQQSNTAEANGENKPNEKWSLSDKIAVVATVAAFLQFVALVITVTDGRRNSRRQLRAYVSGRPDFITSFDETHWPIAKITIQNFGQTPAYELVYRCRVEAFSYPLPKNFTLPNIESNWTAPVVLFPNLPLIGEMGRGTFFTGDELADLRNRTRRIYVFGEISYRDVFRRRCWTKFCVSLTAKDDGVWKKLTKNSLEKFPGAVTFETAPVGNDADHR